MIEYGFIDIDGTAIPAEAIEPLPDVSGSTSVCSLVRLEGKRYFLKRLRPELVGHLRYVELMRKEFDIGHRLSHPNLVQYISMGEDIDGPYLITEYVEGETLSQRIQGWQKSAPSLARILRLFQQLLQCLGYLHSHQVVHLDLKPDNILITRIGETVKLIDLGFCYADSHDLTMGRNAVYSAPEQHRANGRPDHRADLYAVGRLLAHLCRLCPELSNRKMQHIIARSTAIDPADRYQSADEMLADLNKSGLSNHHQWRSLFWLVPLTIVFLTAGWLGIRRYQSATSYVPFSFSQDNPLYRVLSADSLTCCVCGIHCLGPDSSLMVFSQVKHEGQNYSITEAADSAF